MEPLRIYVDRAMPADAMDLLRAGTKGHELVFPAKPAASVLVQGERDPQFATVDIALGQPETAAIADAPPLPRVHVRPARIPRAATAQFRELTKGGPASASRGSREGRSGPSGRGAPSSEAAPHPRSRRDPPTA